MSKKKIVYLLGAGATQAVIKQINPEKSLMTEDIQELIESKYSKKGIDPRIWNELVTKGNDVEHLISVLESHYNYSTSDKVRKYYWKALVTLVKDLSKSPPENLYTVLYDLHKNVDGLEEELLCFITLNYEDLLEQSLRKQYDIDYAIDTMSSKSNRDKVKILKLHGSFNWINSRPIQTKSMTSIQHGKSLWIPPGVEKRKDNYPFNLLWGKATECLMECDVVRVIGCSLSRNDWSLIPILYTVQRFNGRGQNIQIEIIDFVETGQNIRKNYRYLNIKQVTEIDDIIAYYRRQLPKASDKERNREMIAQFSNKDKMNPFQAWLDAKIDQLVNEKGSDSINTAKYVYNFYNKESRL
jgi:hypothetical protein